MTSLAGKTFRTLSNSDNGEVGPETVFRYSEKDGLIWADYSGGSILRGHLIGVRLSETEFDLRYHHMSVDGSLKTGICKSESRIGPDGKTVLKEKWKWTCGDGSEGESEIVEL